MSSSIGKVNKPGRRGVGGARSKCTTPCTTTLAYIGAAGVGGHVV